VPTPSQDPPQSELSEAHCGRPPAGAPSTAEQVPPFDGRLHASHCPSHEPSQQTPSTQYPVAHWLAPEHVPPFATSAVHTPAAQ